MDWTRRIVLKANQKDINIAETEQKTFTYIFTNRLTSEAFITIHKKLLTDSYLLKKLDIDGPPLEKNLVFSIQSNDVYRELVILYLQGKYETAIGFARDNYLDRHDINALVAYCGIATKKWTVS